jgi:O-antigen ligase
MLAPMCAAVLLFWPGPWMKILAGLLAAASVVLTFSVGPLLALILSILAVAAFRGRRHVGYLAFAIIVLFGLVFSYLPRNRIDRTHDSVGLYTKWGDDAIVSYRYRRWQSGLNIFRAHPVVGVGHGMFQEHVGQQKYNMLDDGLTPTPTPPENVTISKKFIDSRYILTVAEMGLPGLLLLITVLLLACRRAFFAISDTTDPCLKAILAGCFGMVLAASVGTMFTDFLVRGLALPLVFAISVPIWWAAERD